MKTLIHITLFWLLMVYLGAAFIYMEVNPFNLEQEVRASMLFVAFFGAITSNLLWPIIKFDAKSLRESCVPPRKSDLDARQKKTLEELKNLSEEFEKLGNKVKRI
jgi:hypothetical protein